MGSERQEMGPDEGVVAPVMKLMRCPKLMQGCRRESGVARNYRVSGLQLGTVFSTTTFAESQATTWVAIKY